MGKVFKASAVLAFRVAELAVVVSGLILLVLR